MDAQTLLKQLQDLQNAQISSAPQNVSAPQNMAPQNAQTEMSLAVQSVPSLQQSLPQLQTPQDEPSPATQLEMPHFSVLRPDESRRSADESQIRPASIAAEPSSGAPVGSAQTDVAESLDADHRPPPTTYSAFLRDLPREITDEELLQFFEQTCGPVYQARAVRSKTTGESRGFGMVKFRTLEGVLKALDMKPPVFHGQQINITFFNEKNTLYVGNVPFAMNAAELKAALEEIGHEKMDKFELCLRTDGKSKGYGWAIYPDHEAAKSASHLLSRAQVRGFPLKISVVEARIPDPRQIKNEVAIFLKNIPLSMNEEGIRSLFPGDSGVDTVDLPRDLVFKRHLGHATVRFRTHEQAEQAILRSNGLTIDGKTLVVEWNFRGPKKHRTAGPPPRRGGYSPERDRRGGYSPDRRGDRRGGYSPDRRDDRDRYDDRRGDYSRYPSSSPRGGFSRPPPPQPYGGYPPERPDRYGAPPPQAASPAGRPPANTAADYLSALLSMAGAPAGTSPAAPAPGYRGYPGAPAPAPAHVSPPPAPAASRTQAHSPQADDYASCLSMLAQYMQQPTAAAAAAPSGGYSPYAQPPYAAPAQPAYPQTAYPPAQAAYPQGASAAPSAYPAGAYASPPPAQAAAPQQASPYGAASAYAPAAPSPYGKAPPSYPGPSASRYAPY
ncbi:hypothetical protein PAPYR_634 [Paratrimastix pyriformis]|uniref:RRM domain-containing protein n=1 Tax=Paratrimastix pyriformis TaxID=342808 RepID=A0ABQ8UU42_9EUKA|nr:hypothetical protein PAPYR_634 [Paratrimastix pyriformis]